MSNIVYCCSRFSLNSACKCRENAAKDRDICESLLSISNDDPFYSIHDTIRDEAVKPIYTMKQWEENTEDIWFQNAFPEVSEQPAVNVSSPKKTAAGLGQNQSKTPSKYLTLAPHRHIVHYRLMTGVFPIIAPPIMVIIP